MCYLAKSSIPPEQAILVFVWRGTVMPDETACEEALEAFRQALGDVLDWNTAEYHSGPMLMHS